MTLSKCAIAGIAAGAMALAAFAPGLALPAEDTLTILVSRGAGGEALAVNAQGAPFLAGADGAIVRVLARNSTLPFVAGGRRTTGLAFDASGNLYASDSRRKVVLKIAPWTQISVFAEGFAAPEGVAWSRTGELYVADSAASRLYRVTPGAKPSVVASEISGAHSVAVSGDGLYLYVADSARRIWRLRRDGAGRAVFAAFTDQGRPAGMALDEQGNLYVARDGGGKVSVLDPQGKLLRAYSVPGPRVTGVAFGGADLKTLYVSEAGAGAVYRVSAPYRAQLLPWESDAPLRIVEPVNGAILNRHDGQAAPSGLRIVVKGSVRGNGPVTVNGAAAAVRDGRFEAPLLIRAPETRIVASSGGQRHAITVLWDRLSFPRYRVSTDDNIFFLRDIARNADKYKSIFENDYMAFWREMHRKYGAKVHHNVYYETEGFTLSQMPAKFRGEWQANAGWIQLTFHARANDPDHIYIQSPAEEVARDYRLVTREIERFAGKELVSPFTTVHWGEMTREAARALRAEGVRGLVAMGGLSRPDGPADGLPNTCLYLPIHQWAWLKHHDYWKDIEQDLIIVRQDIVLNSVPLDRIVPHLERQTADPGQSEVIQLLIHEQYFHSFDRHYLPDFRARVERAIEWATRRGYKPVFYKDGFVGAR